MRARAWQRAYEQNDLAECLRLEEAETARHVSQELSAARRHAATVVTTWLAGIAALATWLHLAFQLVPWLRV